MPVSPIEPVRTARGGTEPIDARSTGDIVVNLKIN